MAIPTTYTGQNSGAAPIYQGGKTEAALGQGIQNLLGAKQQDLAYAKQEEQSFLKSMEIDPITVANKRAMDNQVQLIEEFQSKWSGIYKDRGGRLNVEDKAALRADQMAIKARQGTVQASYDQYLKDFASFNPRYHDPLVFAQKSQEYLQGDGTYNGGMIEEKAMDATDYDQMFIKSAKSLPTGTNVVERGGQLISTPTSDVTDEWIRSDVTNKIFQTNAARKRAEMNFMSLGQTEREEILDMVDKDNNDTPDRDEWKNAIVEAEVRRLTPFYRPGPTTTKPVGMTAWDRARKAEDTLSRIQSAVRTKSGVGINENIKFHYSGSNVPSQTIKGKGSGIVFTYDKVSAGEMTDIPSTIIPQEFKDRFGDVDQVRGRPLVIKDGRVEWVATGEKWENISEQKYWTASNSERDKNMRQAPDGTYQKKVKIDEARFSVPYTSALPLLESAFPGLVEVVNMTGLNQGGESQGGITGSLFK